MLKASTPASNDKPIAEYNDGVYEAAAGNEDILAGYQFCATLDPRTPLYILLRHGKVAATLPTTSDRTDPADGIWTPKPKSWKELGLAFKELPPSQIASSVGPVPEDGGEFLKMLTVFRREVESSGTPIDRAERAFRAVHGNQKCRAFVSSLGWTRPESLDEYVGFSDALGTPSLPFKLAKALYLEGFTSRSLLEGATDAMLLAVKGVGPKKVDDIKRALGGSAKE